MCEISARSSVSAWSVEELVNGDLVQATRLPANGCTDAEAKAWEEHAEARAQEVFERHLIQHRQQKNAVEPVRVAGCMLSAWLLKVGTKYTFRWHERLFAVDAVHSTLLYYARDKASGELVLRGEAVLHDIIEQSPLPLVAFAIDPPRLLGARAARPSRGEADNASASQQTRKLIVRIEEPQERELWLNVGRALRKGHAAAIQAGACPPRTTPAAALTRLSEHARRTSRRRSAQ